MLKYIILGIVQGLTEFLPVSSSGHLIIMQKILGVTHQGLVISIVLHLGTLVALVIFFFKDILGLLRDARLLLLIAIVTVITGIIGIAGKDFFEGFFSSPRSVAIGWIFTGIILILTKRFINAKRDKLSIKDSLILGLTQGIAIIPGISRSGITISTLLFRGINREMSFKFSFLVAIPVILGAALFEAKKIGFAFGAESKNLAAGFCFSFLAGLFALWALKIALKKSKLHYFGYYCIFIAIITLIFLR